MTKIKFCCPKCGFSTTISEDEIPQAATQCKCPNCKELLLLSEATRKLDSAPSNNLDQAIEECFEKIQSESAEKQEAELKSSNNYFELVEKGISLVEQENIFEAMHLFEEAEKLNSTAKVRSYLAYCRAKVHREYSDGINTCISSLKEEPAIADHYLNLGRIYLLINKKRSALQTFKKGIKLGPNPQLMQELRKFEMRKPPVMPTLPRDHFLNKKLGKLLSRLRWR